ncbi:MAG: sigma-70 family RNA polymerase sigma factor [Panacibacter sp.]
MATEALSDTNYLLEQLRLKDCSAFAELYDKYAPALFGIIYKIVHDTSIGEELLQDVFVKVWKNIERYDAGKGTLFTWMLNIARNTCLDYLRSSEHKTQKQRTEELKTINAVDNNLPYNPENSELRGLHLNWNINTDRSLTWFISGVIHRKKFQKC